MQFKWGERQSGWSQGARGRKSTKFVGHQGARVNWGWRMENDCTWSYPIEGVDSNPTKRGFFFSMLYLISNYCCSAVHPFCSHYQLSQHLKTQLYSAFWEMCGNPIASVMLLDCTRALWKHPLNNKTWTTRRSALDWKMVQSGFELNEI